MYGNHTFDQMKRKPVTNGATTRPDGTGNISCDVAFAWKWFWKSGLNRCEQRNALSAPGVSWDA